MPTGHLPVGQAAFELRGYGQNRSLLFCCAQCKDILPAANSYHGRRRSNKISEPYFCWSANSLMPPSPLASHSLGRYAAIPFIKAYPVITLSRLDGHSGWSPDILRSHLNRASELLCRRALSCPEKYKPPTRSNLPSRTGWNSTQPPLLSGDTHPPAEDDGTA